MTRSTDIDGVEHLVDILIVDSTAKVFLECLCNLIFGEIPIMVNVYFTEQAGKGLLLSFGQQMSNNVRISCLLQLLGNLECLHVCKSILDFLLRQLIEVFLHVFALVLVDVILSLEKDLVLQLHFVKLEPLVIKRLLC